MPILANDCNSEQQTFNRAVVAYGRTIVASKAFEELLSIRMREAYVKCINDPYYERDLETQIAQVLAACRATKTIRINCTGGDGNASAGIGSYDLKQVPELSWGGWFQGISECALQNNCTWAGFPWPYTQSAEIIWHELMHQYGYGHGANFANENNLAKINCGIDAAANWHFQHNTIPYIVGRCVEELIHKTTNICGDIRACPSPNQIKVLDTIDGTTCSCRNDPGNKGLGIIELKNGKLNDIAMLGDHDWIGDWHYNSSDNKLIGEGDFNGDGNKDFILSSSWGIGILTFDKPHWRQLVVKPNGSWFGGWNFDSRHNRIEGTGDFNGDGKDDIVVRSNWGLGILTLNSSGSLSSLMKQPKNTWFGNWRWDASINSGKDKIYAISDFNKDNKADILVTSSWGIGILTLSGNSMTAYVAKPNGTGFGGWNFDSRHNWVEGTGDFNGDGKDDIVVRSDRGLGILTLNNNGSLASLMTQPKNTWFSNWRWDASINSGKDKIYAISDFNKDNKADILVTSSWGIGILTLSGNTMNAYLAKPNGTWFGGWNFDSRHNQILKIADLNADGKQDMVVKSGWGLGILSLNAQNSNLNSLDNQPHDALLGSWLNESSDAIISVGNFIKSSNNEELLLKRN